MARRRHHRHVNPFEGEGLLLLLGGFIAGGAVGMMYANTQN